MAIAYAKRMLRLNPRLIAYFTFAAFMLNAILPFFAVYDPPSTASTQKISSPFGEKILICTGEGFKWVTWKELQTQGGHPKHDTHYKCALCYVAAHTMQDAPQQANTGPVRIATNIDRFSGTRVHDSTHTNAGFSSRAPPYLLIS